MVVHRFPFKLRRFFHNWRDGIYLDVYILWLRKATKILPKLITQKVHGW